MKPSQIEYWALRIIDRVNDTHPIEDSRVELKSEWIEPQKAARQIAGHANSSRGDSIIWLFGVDEKLGVLGVDYQEYSEWLAKVKSNYDGTPPRFVETIVSVRDKSIVAILIETDAAPFVVKNPNHGKVPGVAISHEVPWREGTSTRSATRSDLIRILVPIIRLPSMEVLSGELKTRTTDSPFLLLTLSLYITPQNFPTIIPFHKCSATVFFPNISDPFELSEIRITPPYRPLSGSFGSGWENASKTIDHSDTEVLIHGSGLVEFSGKLWLDKETKFGDEEVPRALLRLQPTHTDLYNTLEIAFSIVPANEGYDNMWVVKQP